MKNIALALAVSVFTTGAFAAQDDVLEQQLGQQAALLQMPVFTLEISQGEPVVTRQSPLMEYTQCEDMAKTAKADVTRSYTDTHPDGWVDPAGNVWALADWSFECVRVMPVS